MKIALMGYGQMGQLVEQLALTKGHHIAARFSRFPEDLDKASHQLAEADMAFDFSHPSAVLENLRLCLSLDKPLVIGTTGWEERLPTAKQWVLEKNGSCLYAPNFSLGIYLFKQVLAYAASLFQPFPDYDVSGVELHHRQKADRPSGTAKALTRSILDHMPRISSLDFSSLRCGHMPGTHTLYFDSAVDTLTFTHEARSRHGFALGALIAAEWLLDLVHNSNEPEFEFFFHGLKDRPLGNIREYDPKVDPSTHGKIISNTGHYSYARGLLPRKGFFTFEDVMRDLLQENKT